MIDGSRLLHLSTILDCTTEDLIEAKNAALKIRVDILEEMKEFEPDSVSDTTIMREMMSTFERTLADRRLRQRKQAIRRFLGEAIKEQANG